MVRAQMGGRSPRKERAPQRAGDRDLSKAAFKEIWRPLKGLKPRRATLHSPPCAPEPGLLTSVALAVPHPSPPQYSENTGLKNAAFRDAFKEMPFLSAA